MAKLIFYICIAMFVGAVIAAPKRRENSGLSCSRAGDSCGLRGGCCGGLICHRYSGRCTVEITPEMLINQRNNLRRTGIDTTH